MFQQVTNAHLGDRGFTAHQFAQSPAADIPRSRFDRSHPWKGVFNAGYLIPFFHDEVLPGDTHNLNSTIFARLQTPIVPFMDNLYLDTFYFFVPNRLVWTHWEKFNGAQDNPGDSISFTIPVNTAPGGAGYAVNSLQDYFGLPTAGMAGTPGNVVHSQLPLRMYNLIWNTWFRDENLQNSVTVDTGDGPDTPANYVLLQRGKRHDYFTSCLPWTQKGAAVALPLTGNAPVDFSAAAGSPIQATSNSVDFSLTVPAVGTAIQFQRSATTAGANWITGAASANAATNTRLFDGVYVSPTNAQFRAISGVIANLAAVTAATINSLRTSFQIQKLLERDARGGTRYVEIIRSHFGVVSPDFRLQRPEYLGGGSAPIHINPVAQTAISGATPGGNLFATGTVLSNRNGFTKSFVEHGYIIGLMAVRADLTYQQGLEKHWSRSTRYDFYWPAFSHLGEQAVLNQEIYFQGNGATADTQVFGYQERYAEYRYKPGRITGSLRSTAATPLDIWHLAQNFGALPVLNSSFIVDNPPVNRVVAVTSQPQFICDVYHKLSCARPMPVYSVPGLIDHF